jgi:hypothetical protein
VQHQVNASGAVRADQNVGCALASVPGGERDPPAHLVLRAGKHGHQTIADFGVWIVPYPGGVFSDDLSRTATNAAVRAVLARTARSAGAAHVR